jgi:8-oxo-dGTP diphosphatase
MHHVFHVSCAIIEDVNKVLIARRSAIMKHPLQWEFPGGKIEEGETPEACILREIKEELNIEIEIKSKLPLCIIIQNEKELHLFPFVCRTNNRNPKPKEHQEIRWVEACDVLNFDMIEADIRVLEKYLEYLSVR